MSARIAWAALMRFGLIERGMSPEAFWDLTPAELLFMSSGGRGEGGAMTRAGLQSLIARFPDGDENGGSDGGS